MTPTRFLVRKRSLPGTAISQAASFDASFLRDQGEDATVLPLDEGGCLPQFPTGTNLIIEGGGWLHPNRLKKLTASCPVTVRIHASPSFLYFERPGACMTEYIRRCRAVEAEVVFVSRELADAFGGRALGICYPLRPFAPLDPMRFGVLRIGCFGALRPLKNHLSQLLAAGLVARTGRAVEFHVNDRAEDEGAHLLRELEAAAAMLRVKLMVHKWASPDEFREKIVPQMSVGACMSFAESFCITAADFVSAGVPVLSGNLPWLEPHSFGLEEMAHGLTRGPLQRGEWGRLADYIAESRAQWRETVRMPSERHSPLIAVPYA